MPFKDKYGYWRRDQTVVDYAPDKCPVCKSRNIDTELEPDDDEINLDLMLAYHPEYQDVNETPTRIIELFSFIRCFWECDDCGAYDDYNPDWYFDPEKGDYFLPPMVTPEEAAKLEVEAERARLEQAGQLRLIE